MNPASKAGPALSGKRRLIVAVLVIGVGLAAAPAIFQMFSRAPGGGEMLEEFEPYMDADLLGRFTSYLDQTGAATEELDATVPRLYEERLGLSPGSLAADHPSVATFLEEFPAIHDDMGSMVVTISENIDNYDAVNALPPFPLFPYFFLLPGMMIAAAGVVWLRRPSSRAGTRKALIALGIGLVAAPAIFQMFTRAPLGGEMINDFKPLMTTERITQIQGYFLTMGAGEGLVRNQVIPRLQSDGAMTADEVAQALPETAAFIEIWPSMSLEMAPMMGAMSDNIGNFQGVAAMPPFPLFPWFFVFPGMLVAGLAWRARMDGPADEPTIDITDSNVDTPQQTEV